MTRNVRKKQSRSSSTNFYRRNPFGSKIAPSRQTRDLRVIERHDLSKLTSNLIVSTVYGSQSKVIDAEEYFMRYHKQGTVVTCTYSTESLRLMNDMQKSVISYLKECPICYDTMWKNKLISTSECTHSFCQICTNKLTSNNQYQFTCPMCRTAISSLKDSHDNVIHHLTTRADIDTDSETNPFAFLHQIEGFLMTRFQIIELLLNRLTNNGQGRGLTIERIVDHSVTAGREGEQDTVTGIIQELPPHPGASQPDNVALPTTAPVYGISFSAIAASNQYHPEHGMIIRGERVGEVGMQSTSTAVDEQHGDEMAGNSNVISIEGDTGETQLEIHLYWSF